MLKILITILVTSSLFGSQGKWDTYYQNTLNIDQPYYTLFLAIQYFEREEKTFGLAADLGTGTGRDSLFLLDKGWKVLAIDAEPLAIEILSERAKKHCNLEVMVSSYSAMVLPDNLDLINASLSLPFCEPEEFIQCWQNITDHLAVGGRFAGHFLGENDDWASNPSMNFHSKEQILALFKDKFIIEYLQEEEGLLPNATGGMKHWHIFHVVAKKNQE